MLIAEESGRKEWDNIRKGARKLLSSQPTLMEEFKKTGYIRLEEFDNEEGMEIPYNFAQRLESNLKENKKNIQKVFRFSIPNIQGNELIEWFLNIDSEWKGRFFSAMLEDEGLYDDVDELLSEDEFESIFDMKMSSEVHDKLFEFLSSDTFPGDLEDTYFLRSEGGTIIPYTDLPSEFSDCVSEYGVGYITISKLVFYKYDVVRNLVNYQVDYDSHSEVYSIYISDKHDTEYSFSVDSCIPRWNDKSWNKKKDLPKDVAQKVSNILSQVSSNYDFDSAICKLHMRGDIPVLSFRNKLGTDDYGLASIFLELCPFTIKEVYFIFSKEENCKVSSMIAKLNDDGEYTLSVYFEHY